MNSSGKEDGRKPIQFPSRGAKIDYLIDGVTDAEWANIVARANSSPLPEEHFIVADSKPASEYLQDSAHANPGGMLVGEVVEVVEVIALPSDD